MNGDRIYSSRYETLAPFAFNDQVASVFPDMAERSIPGYAQVLDLLTSIVPCLIDINQPHLCYDLGCSRGAGSFALAGISDNLTVHALDNSQPMINRLEQSLEQSNRTNIRVQRADICNTRLEPSSLVLLHYTLQFIEHSSKQQLIEKIYQSLKPGGWLLMVEKVLVEDLPEMSDWHEQFKRNRGYSELEITQKRQALEKVMHPETIETHYARLRSTGFDRIGCWHQAMNFVALAAHK